jgi:hypothetical protein
VPAKWERGVAALLDLGISMDCSAIESVNGDTDPKFFD